LRLIASDGIANHESIPSARYVTVWNRGVAARRRVLALWARSEEARALRKWRAVGELAHMLRGLAHTMLTNLYRRLRVQGIHNWRLNAIARRTLKALSGNLIRTSHVAMIRVGFSALRRVASVRRVLAGFFRAAVTLQMGKAARHALNVLRGHASSKRMLGSLRYKHRTAAVKLCLLGWHRRAIGLQAIRRAKRLAIQRWARMREFGALDRWQSQVQKRHALRRALRHLLHREISRGFVTWGAFVSTRSAQRAALLRALPFQGAAGTLASTPGLAALPVRGIRGSPRATVGGHSAAPSCRNSGEHRKVRAFRDRWGKRVLCMWASIEGQTPCNSAQPSDGLRLPAVSRGSHVSSVTANPGVLATIPATTEIPRATRPPARLRT
jgi:hypothetical protein